MQTRNCSTKSFVHCEMMPCVLYFSMCVHCSASTKQETQQQVVQICFLLRIPSFDAVRLSHLPQLLLLLMHNILLALNMTTAASSSQLHQNTLVNSVESQDEICRLVFSPNPLNKAAHINSGNRPPITSQRASWRFMIRLVF